MVDVGNSSLQGKSAESQLLALSYQTPRVNCTADMPR